MKPTLALESKLLESYSPVFSISCASVQDVYVQKKAEGLHPLQMETQLQMAVECLGKARSVLKTTPCEAIRKALHECLSSSTLVDCKALENQLEECTAKHVGILD